AVAPTKLEVRDRDGAVDRRVEGDRDDHRERRLVITAPISITQKAIAIGIFSESTKLRARSRTLAAGTSRAARKATVAARRPSTRTVTLPSRAPRSSGPRTSLGALTSTA